MKLNKKQKRTATIASMAALLAVVLGMGGQTFAKYIETNTAPAQNAVVAKWGVVALITDAAGNEDSAAKMFKQSYSNATSQEIVKGATGLVVAPGTSGSISVEVTGTPEVAANVNYVFSLTDIHLKDYYPITWTVNTVDYNGATAMTSVANAVSDMNGNYAPGTNLGTKSVTIEWEWPFTQGKDAEDTILANIASDGTPSNWGDYNGTNTVWELSYSLSVTITQAQIVD